LHSNIHPTPTYSYIDWNFYYPSHPLSTPQILMHPSPPTLLDTIPCTHSHLSISILSLTSSKFYPRVPPKSISSGLYSTILLLTPLQQVTFSEPYHPTFQPPSSFSIPTLPYSANYPVTRDGPWPGPIQAYLTRSNTEFDPAQTLIFFDLTQWDFLTWR